MIRIPREEYINIIEQFVGFAQQLIDYESTDDRMTDAIKEEKILSIDEYSEKVVKKLKLQGKSNREIAKTLGISERTIYRINIKNK